MSSLDDLPVFASSNRDKVTGAFVLTLLSILVIAAVYSLQGDGGGLRDHAYQARLSNSYGIEAGGPVSLSGLRIGSVDSVVLEPSTSVLITINLKPDYEHFYRENSHLEVDSQLAIGNVISGNGLIFVPGPESGGPLATGALLETIEPLQVNSLVGKDKLEAMVESIQLTVTNLGAIVEAVNKNQDKLISTIDNSVQITETLLETSSELPALLADVRELTLNLSGIVSNMDTQSEAISADTRAVLEKTLALSDEAIALLHSLTPIAEKSPILMEDLLSISRETEILLQRLNQHWLLGGDLQPVLIEPGIDVPGDEELYKN